MQNVLEQLRKRGYDAQLFASAQEASHYLLGQIGQGASVGIGGSVTVQQMGLSDALRKRGHEVFWHWEAGEEGPDAMREKAATADVYLCSANALSRDGLILNMDGTGNRVAAMLYGPGAVYLLIGRNKLAADWQSASERVRNVAAPHNARRLGLNTPCAKTGACAMCRSKDNMCGALVTLERPVTAHPMHVLLIEEDLGY